MREGLGDAAGVAAEAGAGREQHVFVPVFEAAGVIRSPLVLMGVLRADSYDPHLAGNLDVAQSPTDEP